MLIFFLALTINCLQTSLTTKLTQLGVSNMGRSIILLSQLDQTNTNELMQALNQIKNNILDKIETETKSYTTYTNRQQSDIEYHEHRINDLQVELATLQVEIRRLDRSITFQEADIISKKQEVQNFVNSKQSLIDWQKREDQVYTNQQNSYNKALSSIDTAIDLLEKGKQSNFIEEHSDTFSVVGEELQNNLEPEYQQISLTFSQIAYEKFADHDLIRRSTRLLQKLRASISDQKIKLQNTLNAEKSQNDIAIKLHENKIQQVNNDLIKILMEDHEVMLQQYKLKKSLVDQIQQQIQNSQQLIIQLNNEIQLRQKNYKQLISEYQQEIQIINDCVQQIQNH
ncbi:unnamed protein product (macronuclear) [Paramecium tetraurelia]|uniref:Uncharacterized protein n=1 Tax=Paramecium tetraurelia TaxID=5888 RepID=A0CE49_PARTE|nr:uncharacterized protein GSPATT00037502001 [Paramecium tetraurelia]CAK69066.1 unnamed protein product [Paramecium tetraurelia]|eukprot:XP_001436463.1 hypothetical protein (macronuclear) [Paramecium tetraurelia strain d4-2]